MQAEGERAQEARRLSRFVFYGATRTTVEALFGLRGLVLAALLGPEAFGLWALFRLVVGYGAIANFGLDRGLELEVVRARSAEPARDAEAVAWGRSAAGYIWLVFGVLSLGCAAASFAVAGRDAALVLGGIAAGLLLDRLWIFGKVYLRAAAGLRRLATRELAHAFLHLSVTLVLAALAGLPGAFAGFALATFASVGWVARDVPLAPSFEPARIRRLLRVGLPLSTALLLAVGLETVDRLVVAAAGGTALLGTYAFAVAVAGVAGAAALAIRTVVFPQVFAAADERSAVANAEQHLRQTVRPFGVMFPPLMGALGLALAPLVTAFAPEFAAAAPVVRLFVFTGVFSGLHGLGLLSVVATGSERRVPYLAAGAFVLNGVLAWAALSGGFGITGVAVGAVLARGAFAAGILGLAARATLPRPGRAVLGILAPSVWCLAAVEAIGRLVPVRDGLDALAALALYALCLAPLAPVVLRELRRLRGA